jgi:hypothetical protein
MQRGTNSVMDRMIGAALLKPDAYEAVERDTNATSTALLIVVGTAIAAGIGDLTHHGLRGLISGVIAGLISWVLYALAAYFIGSTIFKTSQTATTLGELLRTLGFAQVPAFLLILSGIFLLGAIVSVVVFFWVLATTIVALRQALDFTTTGRAIGTAIVAWLFYIIPYLILLAIL